MSYSRISASGSFVGNGSSQNIVIGTGWEPAIVWVGVGKASGGNTSTRGFSLKLNGMPSSSTFYLRVSGIVYEASGGITINSDGFSVGSQAIHNANGQTIYWWAIRTGPHVEVGTYTGNQSAASTVGQVITTARPPNKSLLVIVRALTTGVGGGVAIRYGEMAANSAISISTSDGSNSYSGWANGFDFTATSFSVSNDNPLYFNLSSQLYYYVLIHNSDGASDGSGLSFGSMRHYHHHVRTGIAGTNEVVDYGLPTEQLVYHTVGGPIYIMNWDPMPSGAAFYTRNANNEKYATSGGYPIRTSTGYETGTINPSTITRSLFFHY